jgi:hypothetical protein
MRRTLRSLGALLLVVAICASAAPAGEASGRSYQYDALGRLANVSAAATSALDDPASVSSLAQSDGGWELMVDVVELRRVPDTASLLATYRVTTDDSGDVAGYERVRRFNRGEAD